MDVTKPRIITKCPANAYTEKNERVVEYASDSGGGLIHLIEVEGTLHVTLYRHDDTVRIHVTEGD